MHVSSRENASFRFHFPNREPKFYFGKFSVSSLQTQERKEKRKKKQLEIKFGQIIWFSF